MENYHLDEVLDRLKGPPREQLIMHNYWAAIALDRYHNNSEAVIEFVIDGESIKAILKWDSDFQNATMKERKDMANFGGVALAWFVMSILFEYDYVEQTEIGDGVDYRFNKKEPEDDELNFLSDFQYIEISGILEESKTNTLKKRIREKHDQIRRGSMREESSSVIVTLFSEPKTVKEIHR